MLKRGLKMRYVSAKRELVEEGDWDYKVRLSLSQLMHIVKLATVEAQLSGKPFVFAIYDELFKFNRKESINFLMIGVCDDFFNLTDGDRGTVLSLVGKFYYNKRWL